MTHKARAAQQLAANAPAPLPIHDPAASGDVETFFTRSRWAEIVNGLTAGARYFALCGDYVAMTRTNHLAGLIAQRWLTGGGDGEGRFSNSNGEAAPQQAGTGDLPPPGERAMGAAAGT